MFRKKEDINPKMQEIGRLLQLENTDICLARRTAKHIVSMVLIGGIFMILGNLLMPGGPAGLYYTAVSIKDFQLLLSGFL
jgi:hypothetical protein